MLSESEIVFNKDIDTYEPCSTCLEVALDAAYSQGFSSDADLDDPDMQDEFGNGAIETLDPDFQRDDGSFADAQSVFGDASDIHYFGGHDE